MSDSLLINNVLFEVGISFLIRIFESCLENSGIRFAISTSFVYTGIHKTMKHYPYLVTYF
jgi:hypothetical protein